MNKRFLIPAIAALFAVLLLAGCTMEPPLENTERVMSLKFDLQGKTMMVMETHGTLTDSASEWADCDATFKELLNFAILASGSSGTEMTEEQKQSIDRMKYMRDHMRCEFEMNEAEGTGVMSFVFEANPEVMKLLNEGKESEFGVKKGSNGSFEANLQFPEAGGAGMMGTDTEEDFKELRIYVEGELIGMTPAGYTKGEGYYAYSAEVWEENVGKNLHIEYGPPKPAAFLSLLGLELSFELFLILLLGLLALIALVVIVFFVLKKRKKEAVDKLPDEARTTYGPTDTHHYTEPARKEGFIAPGEETKSPVPAQERMAQKDKEEMQWGEYEEQTPQTGPLGINRPFPAKRLEPDSKITPIQQQRNAQVAHAPQEKSMPAQQTAQPEEKPKKSFFSMPSWAKPKQTEQKEMRAPELGQSYNPPEPEAKTPVIKTVQPQTPITPIKRPFQQNNMASEKPLAIQPRPAVQHPTQNPVQPEPVTRKPMHSSAQTSAMPLNPSSDEAQIQRLVKILAPKKFEYSRQEVKAVMAEEGYTDRIAEEVIRRLGI